jgi:rhodanese-related sulfurtransferase
MGAWSSSDVFPYSLIAIIAVVLLKRVLTKIIVRRKIPDFLKDGAVIIDVRSPGEYSAGHAFGSRNIPLDDLERGIQDLDTSRWVIVCCASGARSGMARRWLRTHGFQHVLNGGSWRNLP